MRLALISFWLVASIGQEICWADSFSGVVSEVPDGNTLIIRDSKARAYFVEFSCVAAPVGQQPFALVARQKLRHMVWKKKVWVDWYRHEGDCRHRRDARGCRRLGKVFLDGSDIGLKMIQLGFAWYDVRQADEQSTADRGLYSESQDHARIEHLGLWRGRNPVEPWMWRKGRGTSLVSKYSANRRQQLAKKNAGK